MFVALISTPKHLQRSTISIQNGKTFPDAVENPIVSQLTVPTTNYSAEEGHTTTIFLNPYTIWHKDQAALMTLNNTTDRDSTSNQYPQTTTHQSWTDLYPVFPSMWPMGSKRRIRVSFGFFQKNYLTDRRVNETVATVEELRDLWNPGARDGFPRFVMNCSCLFQL